MSKKDFSMGEAVNFGFEKTKKWFWLMVAVTATSLILSSPKYTVDKISDADGSKTAFSIIFAVFSVIVGIGVTNISLRLAENKKIQYSDLFTKTKLFWRFLGASILYGLIVCGGLILFIVPGIFWGVRYQYFAYLIVENENMTTMEALRESAKITDGIIWPLFVFDLLLLLINIAGAIAFGVGLLIAQPIANIASAHVYKKLSKEVE